MATETKHGTPSSDATQIAVWVVVGIIALALVAYLLGVF